EADPAAWPEARRAAWRDLLSHAFRALLVAASLAFVAWPGARRRRGDVDARARAVQLGLLVLVAAYAVFAFRSDEHPFWPLSVAIPLLAAAPLPGAPRRGGVMAYAAWAVASLVIIHVVFFGEDRYHVVATPLLALLAAAALRTPGARSNRPAADPEEPERGPPRDARRDEAHGD
ncbi:MAG TPA: hypothetical protein VHB21_04725, partial [Minicystis sp.]|nr:hypothetical protein [Minicystis sp.]